MVRVLNVAEKNDAAKSLANVLSQGRPRMREGFSRFNKIYEFEYRLMNQQVTMTMTSVSGHLLGLEFIGTFKSWRSCNPVDLFDVPVEKHCPENFVDIKRTLEREVRGCQSLVIWTDCDREGENIGYEVIHVCQAVKPNIKVYRAKFSEITPQSVARAVNNLGPPDPRINDAVDVRQELDLRIGAAFTRFQTLRLQKLFPETLAEQLISYGSCQFPTLGFVVERYKQVQEFVPEPFWKLKVIHLHEDVQAEFSWKRNRLFNFLACEVLYNQCKENPLATVVDVKSKSKNKWRPQALDTVELEKLASRKLKVNAKETMKIAEKLYTQGLISYPRTETNIFPKDMDLVALVEAQTQDPDWGEFAQQVLNNGPNPRNGSKSDQAHPPIHPLKYTNSLQGNEKKIYEYVVRHFLACVSQDAQGHETVVEIDIALERFSAQGLMILARNYLDVYPYEKWNAKEIPLYQQGDQFEPNSIEILAGETSAPPLLTEADLIALMEKHGIGTDATHAEHIETVKSRMYVGLRPDGRFVPGQLGMGLVEGYDSMGYEMSKPHLRAQLEADLKLICEGKKRKEDVLKDQIKKYKEVFIEACRQAQKLDAALSQYLGEAQPLPDDLDEVDSAPSVIRKCPRCGNPMTLRTKKDGKGFYIGCSGYPNCKACIWLPDFVLHVHATQEICQNCGPDQVSKLKFKFKQGSVPLTIPNNYIGCIGGCDEMLTEILGIRPLSGHGNNILPRTEIRSNPPSTGTSTIKRQNGGCSTNITNDVSTPTIEGNRRIAAVSSSSGTKTSRTPSNHKPVSSSNLKCNKPGSSTRDFHTHALSDSALNSHQEQTQNRGIDRSNRKSVTNMDSGFGPVPNRQDRTFSSISAASPYPRGPLSSISNSGFNIANRRAQGAGDSIHFGIDSAAEKAIVCSCGNDAVILTVRKEGPNTGRQFYKCSGQNGENCNFFLWADQNDQSSTLSSSSSSSLTHGREGFGGDGFSSTFNLARTGTKSTLPAGSVGSDEVSCRCGIPAKSLTVQKQGPNTGRPFFACSKPREQSCNFFQWADQAHGMSNFGQDGSNSGSAILPWASGSKGMSAQKKRPASDGTTSGQNKQRKPPSCGYCGQPGHRRNKCPERLDDF
ncbi:DNA topoisomerase [Plakobranchus ocellatus]|uniref:DNA topoisomerase n=1 Tax=Plakobranchus ocellatus TaxID=259542 RepID=A0AAV4C365_9GAST|nr:DNA topoisomerase [Plakobranchus ocellatus]